jgi:hypothetical protein
VDDVPKICRHSAASGQDVADDNRAVGNRADDDLVVGIPVGELPADGGQENDLVAWLPVVLYPVVEYLEVVQQGAVDRAVVRFLAIAPVGHPRRAVVVQEDAVPAEFVAGFVENYRPPHRQVALQVLWMVDPY